MKAYTASKNDAGKRLDKFLAEKLPQLTRSHIQRSIKRGTVTLNGKLAKPSRILKTGGTVALTVKKEVPSPPQSKLVKLDIVFENKDMLVINKPPNLMVHPAGKGTDGTLAGALLHHRPEIKTVGEDPSRPGIVHRLDKDTSGLMVVAKNNETFSWLKKQFSRRRIKKRYLALVHGTPKKKRGYITTRIGKLKGKQTTGRAIEKLGLKSRGAETQYLVRERFKDYSLLEVVPRTGRTHQIRVHLASIGHPIVGDTLYKFKRKRLPPGIERQFLHAYALEVPMPNKKILAFKTDLSRDLARVLEGLTPLEVLGRKISRRNFSALKYTS